MDQDDIKQLRQLLGELEEGTEGARACLATAQRAKEKGFPNASRGYKADALGMLGQVAIMRAQMIEILAKRGIGHLEGLAETI